jgi:hypothetical protein
MSRKLLYVSGLLTCFSCHERFASLHSPETYPAAPEERAALGVKYLREQFEQTPLEILAAALLRHTHLEPTARKLSESYDRFVGMLADTELRSRLNSLEPLLGRW